MLFNEWPSLRNDESNAQRQIRENQRKGSVAEKIIRDNDALRGYEMERTGVGSDYHATKRNMHGRIIESLDIEVKSGNAVLSELQKATQQKKRDHYRVERVTNIPRSFYEQIQ